MSKQTKLEIEAVLEGIKALLFKKNDAYGDSALNPARILSKAPSTEQIMVRIDDKLSRLGHGHALPDESFDDTINDIIGYFVLLQVARAREKYNCQAPASAGHGNGVPREEVPSTCDR